MGKWCLPTNSRIVYTEIEMRTSNGSGVSEMETYFCPIIQLFRQEKILFNSANFFSLLDVDI